MSRNQEDPINRHAWSKVRPELIPPKGWENWDSKKQIDFLKIPSFVIQLKKTGKNWIFEEKTYRHPEPAVASYLINKKNWIYLETGFMYYCTFALLSGVPTDWEYEKVEGRRVAKRQTEKYRSECLQIAQSITIDQIIEHSKQVNQAWMEKGRRPPWGAIENTALSKRSYEALGIDIIRKYLMRVTIGGMDDAGISDLIFLFNHKGYDKIVFVEVKTINDKIRDTQFYFVRNFRDGAGLNYIIAHLHKLPDV